MTWDCDTHGHLWSDSPFCYACGFEYEFTDADRELIGAHVAQRAVETPAPPAPTPGVPSPPTQPMPAPSPPPPPTQPA
jgi:hypothetical protein